jgi:hypothetical protein
MKPMMERDMEGQPLPVVDPSKVAKAAETASNAANKKPRKDRGTRRLSLPALLVGRIEKHAEDVELAPEKFLGKLLSEYEAGQWETFTLPPAVLGRLGLAAEASGRSLSELLAMMERHLMALMGGDLQHRPAIPGAEPEPIPALEDQLVEEFRARLKGKASA